MLPKHEQLAFSPLVVDGCVNFAEIDSLKFRSPFPISSKHSQTGANMGLQDSASSDAFLRVVNEKRPLQDNYTG